MATKSKKPPKKLAAAPRTNGAAVAVSPKTIILPPGQQPVLRVEAVIRQNPTLDLKELLHQAEVRECSDSLYRTIQHMWGALYPNRPFVAGWHIDAICQHLQALTKREIRNLIINVPRRHSKPVWDETLILRRDGSLVPLREIQVGDEVLTHRGRFRKVSDVHVQGELETIRVVTNSGREVFAEATHPFLTPSGWVETGRLKVGQVLAAVVPDACGGPGVTTEEARLLGHLVGDGGVIYSVTFTCFNDEHAADFTRCAEACGFNVSAKRRGLYRVSGNHRRTWVPKGEEMSGSANSWAKHRGIYGLNSHTKVVPNCILQGDLDTVRHFVAAYYMCDGTVNSRDKARKDCAISFSSVSKALLQGVQHLLLRLGIKSRLRTRIQNNNKWVPAGYTHYVLEVGGRDAVTRFSESVPVVGPKRTRLDEWAPVRSEFSRILQEDPVVEVSSGGVRPCRCLTVEEDESFCANDIAVHNSTIVSIMWPAWVWINKPEEEFMFASYGHALTKRDSIRCRRIIESPRYQDLFGDRFHLAHDQNTQTRFDNNKGGFRFATSVGGAVLGEGADVLVADDPNNLREIHNEKKRNSTIEWYREIFASSLNDPLTGIKLLIQQRGHGRDLSGYLQDAEKGEWETLKLPAEYKARYHTVTKIWEDPRTKEGELLWLARFQATYLAKLRKTLGAYAAAAQLDQNPVPAEGGVFKEHWWKFYRRSELPEWHEFDDSCISIDMSFGAKGAGASYTVAQAWGRRGSDFYLLDQIRDQWEYTEAKRQIKSFIAKWKAIYVILIENKANGPAIISDLEEDIPGLFPIDPKGSKESRARAVSPLAEAGNCYFPDPDEPGAPTWVGDVLLEVGSFPKSATDDIVDTLSQALDRLRLDLAFGVLIEDGPGEGGGGYGYGDAEEYRGAGASFFRR